MSSKYIILAMAALRAFSSAGFLGALASSLNAGITLKPPRMEFSMYAFGPLIILSL